MWVVSQGDPPGETRIKNRVGEKEPGTCRCVHTGVNTWKKDWKEARQ